MEEGRAERFGVRIELRINTNMEKGFGTEGGKKRGGGEIGGRTLDK